MENEQKGKLIRVGSVVLGLLAVFIFSKTISEVQGWRFIGRDIASQATISVSGKGEVVVKPDIATFSFGIEEESLVISEAQDKVAKSEKEILAFLEKNGVSKDDVKVSGYNLYPRYDYVRSNAYGSGKQVLAGYVVSEQVEVKVRKISDSGKLIGSLGELGATNLSSLTFGVDKEQDVIKEARQKAIADARKNAEKLAGDLGVSLVRILNYSENAGGYPRPMYYGKGMDSYAGTASVATPELPSGTNKITSEVSVVYEIR